MTLDFDLDWDVPVYHRKGTPTRLCGIDVFHEFEWRTVFRDERTQFRHGQDLAKLVISRSVDGTTPALLLTLRDGVIQGFRHTPKLTVFVVSLPEYIRASGGTALAYVADHLRVDITDVARLEGLVESAEPRTFRRFIQGHMDGEDVACWAGDSEERLEQLRDIAGGGVGDATEAIRALRALGHLTPEDVQSLAKLLMKASASEDLLRVLTSDADGRHATGAMLVERVPERIQDARDAIEDYQALLDNGATETKMQEFIEANPWLLGLDYAAIRPQKGGPSGAMDFVLERYDAFCDLLELKSPDDEIVKAPSIRSDEPVPPPHKYALSSTLAQALAQAIVYRDRLTRHPDAARELHGMRQPRDPRLIIVIGCAHRLPEHRQRVLDELNKSFHRVEIVPYDLIAKRASAVLDNVERYWLGASDDPSPGL